MHPYLKKMGVGVLVFGASQVLGGTRLFNDPLVADCRRSHAALSGRVRVGGFADFQQQRSEQALGLFQFRGENNFRIGVLVEVNRDGKKEKVLALGREQGAHRHALSVLKETYGKDNVRPLWMGELNLRPNPNAPHRPLVVEANETSGTYAHDSSADKVNDVVGQLKPFLEKSPDFVVRAEGTTWTPFSEDASDIHLNPVLKGTQNLRHEIENALGFVRFFENVLHAPSQKEAESYLSQILDPNSRPFYQVVLDHWAYLVEPIPDSILDPLEKKMARTYLGELAAGRASKLKSFQADGHHAAIDTLAQVYTAVTAFNSRVEAFDLQ